MRTTRWANNGTNVSWVRQAVDTCAAAKWPWQRRTWSAYACPRKVSRRFATAARENIADPVGQVEGVPTRAAKERVLRKRKQADYLATGLICNRKAPSPDAKS